MITILMLVTYPKEKKTTNALIISLNYYVVNLIQFQRVYQHRLLLTKYRPRVKQKEEATKNKKKSV
jgi:hypothetical protein